MNKLTQYVITALTLCGTFQAFSQEQENIELPYFQNDSTVELYHDKAEFKKIEGGWTFVRLEDLDGAVIDVCNLGIPFTERFFFRDTVYRLNNPCEFINCHRVLVRMDTLYTILGYPNYYSSSIMLCAGDTLILKEPLDSSVLFGGNSAYYVRNNLTFEEVCSLREITFNVNCLEGVWNLKDKPISSDIDSTETVIYYVPQYDFKSHKGFVAPIKFKPLDSLDFGSLDSPNFRFENDILSYYEDGRILEFKVSIHTDFSYDYLKLIPVSQCNCDNIILSYKSQR